MKSRFNILSSISVFIILSAAGCSTDDPLKQYFTSMHLNEGNIFYTKGDYGTAIGRYTKAIELDPKGEYSFTSYYYRAFSYYNKSDYPSAIPDFSAVIAISPNFDAPYVARGNCYAILKKYREAMADYNDALRINPENSYAYYNRGNTYHTLNLPRKAIDDYSKAILNSLEFFEDAYLRRGAEYNQLGDYDNAAIDLTRVIQFNSDNREAFMERAFSHGKLGNKKKAGSDRKALKDLNIKLAVHYWKVANTLLVNNNSEEAMEYYNKSLELDPLGQAENKVIGDVYVSRGMGYFLEDNFPKAIENFQKALALNPRHWQAMSHLAVCWQRQRMFEKSEKMFLRSLAINPTNDSALYNLAVQYAFQKKHKQAIEYFSRFLRQNPNHPSAFFFRGDQYESIGRHREAITDYNRSIKLGYQPFSVYLNRGSAYLMLSRIDKAVADFTLYIERSDLKKDIGYVYRAEAYRVSGKYKLAITDFERFLKSPEAVSNRTLRKSAEESLEFCRSKIKNGRKNK